MEVGTTRLNNSLPFYLKEGNSIKIREGNIMIIDFYEFIISNISHCLQCNGFPNDIKFENTVSVI